MNTDSPKSPSSSDPLIVDTNGIPARAEDIPALVVPGENPNDESAPAPENVVEMPKPLERTGRILQKGNRRAIAILFETYLDGPRVNLLLARIYSQMENAEREVNRLGFKDVERILQRFKDSRPAATDGEAS